MNGLTKSNPYKYPKSNMVKIQKAGFYVNGKEIMFAVLGNS